MPRFFVLVREETDRQLQLASPRAYTSYEQASRFAATIDASRRPRIVVEIGGVGIGEDDEDQSRPGDGFPDRLLPTD